MDYRHAIDHLLSLVDRERSAPSGPRQKLIYDLGRMEALLERLGSPHLAVPTIHIAGTKGKGSTAALCDAALHAAGYHTGFYSSPHLHSFRERIRLDTLPIAEGKFAALVEQLWPHQQWVWDNAGLGPVSLFEFMTAMAFQCFAQEGVDFQTIEVGLGGRLDATNLVRPQVCVITSLSLDHTAILGESLAQIAAEKAGIIKPGVPVVIAPQQPAARSVLLSVCQERHARPIQLGVDITWEGGPADDTGQRLVVHGQLGAYQLWIPLLGTFQLENAAAAVAALEALAQQGYHVSNEAIREGFARVSWPCRLEVLRRDPLVVADGAHNVQSIAALLDSLPRYLKYRRLLLIVGVSRDKNVSQMVELLAAGKPQVFVSRSRHPRSLAPATLAAQFRAQGVDAAETGTVAEAVDQALSLAEPGDLVLATGSLFVAAEVREAMLGIEPELYPDLLPPEGRASYAAV
ncbi:MAG: folylpolyglutamate synthase/dihydrofolate synthase family protein [Chloroflexota bacterium]